MGYVVPEAPNRRSWNRCRLLTAGWQRCRTRFMTNLLTRVPKRSQPGVATMVRIIYKQLSPEEVRAQADRVITQL